MKYGRLLATLALSVSLISCSGESETTSTDDQVRGRTSLKASYPDNFDQVSERYDEVGFDKLSQQERLVYCIWWLEGEVNGGGFHQFFSNSSGDYTNETLEALTAIGALKTKKLLEKAVEIAFDGKPAPADSDKRNALLERSTEEAEDELFAALDKLDQEFYKYEDPIADLVNKWLSEQK